MNAAVATRIAQEHAAVAGALPAHVLDSARRRRALESFVALGLPTNRDENWRYANLHTLGQLRFAPSTQTQPPDILTQTLPATIQGYVRYIFIDGRFAPELSFTLKRANVTFASLPGNETALSALPTPALVDTRMALLNEAFATDGMRITATDTERPLCIETIFVAGAGAGASYPRLEVRAQPGTRMALIERHISLGDTPHLVNGAVDLQIDQGATVDHYRLQQAGREATWMDTLSARVAADGNYRLHLANLGAQSARSNLQIILEGERAATVLNAVSVPDRQQVHDVFAVIEHAAPDTTTEERFRGIAAEQARVGFNGKMIVRSGAHRTVSRQSLRGLLAGPQAEVDVRPQLEIYTDDVQCSHGATAGKLDDTMLFYLLSRGLERDTAQLLLKWAFIEDVVAKIDLPELRKQIELTLADQMEGAAVLREML